MKPRALLLDVGNTSVKWAVLEDDRIRRTGKVSHQALKSSGFSSLATRLPRQVGQALICNVAGQDFATRLAAFIGIHCGVDAQFAHARREGYGLVNGYRRPRRLGADRWAAMIGARAESKSALCVVDAGSAITIDAVDRDGRHLGGQIIPGLHLMARSLETSTSGIRELPSRMTDPGGGLAHFADGTSRAIRAGALNAICGAIERALKALRKEGMRPRLVLTGGSAAPILEQLDGQVVHRPHLVLEGLATMVRQRSSAAIG